MHLRRPLPAVQGDTLHIVGVGDNRIGKRPSTHCACLISPAIATGPPGSPSSHRNRPDSTSRPSLALPGLKTGAVEACIDRLSPVCGFRPVRAGRLLAPKIPNPTIRNSSPFARLSLTASNTASTASPAADRLTPIRSATRPAISDLFIHALPFSRKFCAVRPE